MRDFRTAAFLALSSCTMSSDSTSDRDWGREGEGERGGEEYSQWIPIITAQDNTLERPTFLLRQHFLLLH